MRVHLTDAAEADFEEIGNFIAEDNPLRADSFVLELVDRCEGLARFPLRYPVFATWRGRELRRCVYGRYLIFYWVSGDTLEVERIIHSARDYTRLLFPDG